MSGHILIDTRKSDPFSIAAANVLDVIGISHYQKRYSENYEGGEYLIAQTLGLEVQFYRADEAEFPDFQYAVNISPVDSLKGDERDPSGDLLHILAKKLASAGMLVASPLDNFIGSPVVFYDGGKVWIDNP